MRCVLPVTFRKGSNVSSQLQSACLGADGERQAGALIYTCYLLKLIFYETKHFSIWL